MQKGRAIAQKKMDTRQPSTGLSRDGTLTLQVVPQDTQGLPVETVCAVALTTLGGKGLRLPGDPALSPGPRRFAPT